MLQLYTDKTLAVARAEKLSVVDGRTALAAEGAEYDALFLDYYHPTVEGHRRLSQAIAEAVVESASGAPALSRPRESRRFAQRPARRAATWCADVPARLAVEPTPDAARSSMHPPWFLLVSTLASAPGGGSAAGSATSLPARLAEHATNRLTLGADAAELERVAHDGLEASLERWLGAAREPRPGPIVGASAQNPGAGALRNGLVDPRASLEGMLENRDEALDGQTDYTRPIVRQASWWLREMARGPAPLRENLALFWHGHFATSFKEVGVADWMVRKVDLEREFALAHFGELLRAIARTPAMLRFLDNEKSRRSHPNENWARELVELHTLGRGNYTEIDVREIARAFTGWTQERGQFVFSHGGHDYGRKTVFGVTGILDGELVIDLILERRTCARFLANKLLAWLEGCSSDDARVDEYADVLLESDYDIAQFLRQLVRDARFVRDEVVGQRIPGPIVHFVELARRLELDVPGLALWEGAAVCGQRLFYAPSVKGWDEGTAWITTNTLVQRDNVTAFLFGLLPESFWADSSDASAWRGSWGVLRRVHASGWEPRARGVDDGVLDATSAGSWRAEFERATRPCACSCSSSRAATTGSRCSRRAATTTTNARGRSSRARTARSCRSTIGARCTRPSRSCARSSSKGAWASSKASACQSPIARTSARSIAGTRRATAGAR